MTWEEIKPVAAALFGEDCGSMTIEELLIESEKRGFGSGSQAVCQIEAAGLLYKWLLENVGKFAADNFIYNLRENTKLLEAKRNASNALEQLNCVE